MNRLGLYLTVLCGCTSTLNFADPGPDRGVDSAVPQDRGVADTRPPDMNTPPDTGVGSGCGEACLQQLSECIIFDGPLCQRTCPNASTDQRAAFVACTESIASQSNCNFEQTTCFSNLTGGSAEEAQCRSACDRYSDCGPVFVARQNCEQRCGARLPEGNEMFIDCVNEDLDACTLRCL